MTVIGSGTPLEHSGQSQVHLRIWGMKYLQVTKLQGKGESWPGTVSDVYYKCPHFSNKETEASVWIRRDDSLARTQ